MLGDIEKLNYSEYIDRLYYEKDFETMEKPRYVDALDAIAKIYEIKGDYNKSIETYKRYIQLLKDEWNVTEGEMIDYPNRQIKRLEKEI